MTCRPRGRWLRFLRGGFEPPGSLHSPQQLAQSLAQGVLREEGLEQGRNGGRRHQLSERHPLSLHISTEQFRGEGLGWTRLGGGHGGPHSLQQVVQPQAKGQLKDGALGGVPIRAWR
jgi:hypothetical protein